MVLHIWDSGPHSQQKGLKFWKKISKLYSMYSIKQSMTMPYNPCGNSICERFNHTLLGLLKSLPKEQKCCWPLHVPSLVFTYNAMPHSITGYQPYELMFGHKAPAVCDAWLGFAHYNDQASTNKCVWLNKQHELLMSVNRWVLKHIKQSAKKSQSRTGGKTLHIPVGNLVLLRDHPEGHNKIQDNYKSELFVVVDHHKDPNVYIIQSLDNKDPKRTVNRWQLSDLKKSQVDPITSDPSIKGPQFDPKSKKINAKPQNSYPYGTSSKTKTASASVQSVKADYEQRGHSGLGQWVGQFFGYIKEAAVWQLGSAKRWSPENMLSYYLAADHQSSFSVVLHMTWDFKLITSWLVCCRVVHGHSMPRLGIWGLTSQDNCWFDYLLCSEPGWKKEGQTCWDRYECSWKELWLLQEW